jgi:tetratricopeptide (TPR) repeat protein
VAIGLALWTRQAWGPDRYRSYSRPQLEAVLARRPNDAAALHQLGLRYLGERRFTEARRTLERALAGRPGSAAIVRALGKACAYQRDFVAARGHFEQAVQLDPRDSPTWKDLGDMRGATGDYLGAIRAYQQALALKPGDVAALVGLGSAYADANNMGKAITTFQEAIAKDPRSAAAYQGLGRAYLSFRRYLPAREALQKAAEIDPYDAHSPAFLGLAFSEQIRTPEDARQALEHLDRAAALGYQAAELYYGRGLVSLSRKEYDPAITALLKATRMDPGAENMAYQLAQAYGAAGLHAQAQRAMARFELLRRSRPELQRLRRQLQAQPDAVGARARLARLCLRTGRTSEALRHYLALSRLQPQDPEVWRGIAATAAVEGKPDLAAQARAMLARSGSAPRGESAPPAPQ